MACVYVLVMILLAISGVDVINDVQFAGYLGALFAVFAGLFRIWQQVSR